MRKLLTSPRIIIAALPIVAVLAAVGITFANPAANPAASPAAQTAQARATATPTPVPASDVIEKVAPNNKNRRPDVPATKAADTEDGPAPILISFPVNVNILDPITGEYLDTLELEATNIDITSMVEGAPNGKTEAILDQAWDRFSQSLAIAPVTYAAPKIESIEVRAVDDIVVVVNVRLRIGTFIAARIRLTLDGLNYTDLDPANADLDALLGDIRKTVADTYGGGR